MRTKDVRLNPFHPSCVGIVSSEEYSVALQIYRVNYWQVRIVILLFTCLTVNYWLSFLLKVFMTLCGLLLFFYSRTLCRNVVFHYATGVGAGIALSLLVITYFVQKKVSALYVSFLNNRECFFSVFLWFLKLGFMLVFSWFSKNRISKTTQRLWKNYQKTMNYQKTTRKLPKKTLKTIFV